MKDLTKIGWEHIRWVALEYKQAFIKKEETHVVRNQHYLKKMNLTNDPAAWVCWELLLKGRDMVTMAVLLRRQYMPPLMDTSQDIALIFRCKRSLIEDGRVHETDLRHACYLAADTFSSEAQSMTL